MANIQTIIKFDGKALENKSMDVAHLATALLSLSDLIKETNAMVNGERVGVKVFVNADLEQKCFELMIDLSLTAWDTAKQLVGDDDIKSAKEIAEWVGIIGASSLGLFQLFKMIRGKKIESTKFVTTKDGKNIVQINITGDGNTIEIPKEVYDIYATPATKQKAVDVLGPLREEGYETLTFYDKAGDKIREYVKFNGDEIPNADGTDLPDVAESTIHTSIIRTNVRIKKAVYEGKAAWTLIYKQTIQAVIADDAWLTDFQSNKRRAPPKSSLDVSLEETYKINEEGEMLGQASYKVIQVHKINLPPDQPYLELSPDGS